MDCSGAWSPRTSGAGLSFDWRGPRALGGQHLNINELEGADSVTHHASPHARLIHTDDKNHIAFLEI